MTIASSIFELQQLQPQQKQEKISKKILWDSRRPQWGCSTFADGSEKQVSQEIENEFPLSNLLRDLTIGDVAHAQQNENKLSFAFA